MHVVILQAIAAAGDGSGPACKGFVIYRGRDPLRTSSSPAALGPAGDTGDRRRPDASPRNSARHG